MSDLDSLIRLEGGDEAAHRRRYSQMIGAPDTFERYVSNRLFYVQASEIYRQDCGRGEAIARLMRVSGRPESECDAMLAGVDDENSTLGEE